MPGVAGLTSDEAERIRITILEMVRELIAQRGSVPPTSLTMHLYWSLYLAVLAYWVADDSPHQEQTLAVVDQSTRLFVASMLPQSTAPAQWPIGSVNGTATPESPEELEV